MYEAAGAMGMVWASRPVTIIGERIAREPYDFLDGRDTVVIGWFGVQLGEHGIDQHLAAAFEALPFDFLNGIVEFKRRKDGLDRDRIKRDEHRSSTIKNTLTSEKASS